MIAPLKAKFDGEADNLAVFLASMRDRACRFNWQLITVPIDDGTMVEFAHPLWASFAGQHQGTHRLLREHADQRRTR